MAIRAWAITVNDHTKDCDVVFKPAAKRVRDAYKGGFSSFSNGLPYPQNRDDLISKIGLMGAGLDFIAYFGHGFNNQLGGHILTDDDRNKLATALRAKIAPGGSIMFYSCFAGINDGLTSILNDKIGMGVWMYGHTSRGHSFGNPDVSEVHSGDSLKFKLFRNVLGDDLQAAWEEALLNTDLWLRFPLMQHDDIRKELFAARLVGTWTTPALGKYTFQWDVSNGVYETSESLCVNPHGSVTDAVSGRAGTWELDEDVVITWGGVDKEVWSLPINPQGQKLRGATGLARRLIHGKFGSVQG